MIDFYEKGGVCHDQRCRSFWTQEIKNLMKPVLLFPTRLCTVQKPTALRRLCDSQCPPPLPLPSPWHCLVIPQDTISPTPTHFCVWRIGHTHFSEKQVYAKVIKVNNICFWNFEITTQMAAQRCRSTHRKTHIVSIFGTVTRSSTSVSSDKRPTRVCFHLFTLDDKGVSLIHCACFSDFKVTSPIMVFFQGMVIKTNRWKKGLSLFNVCLESFH